MTKGADVNTINVGLIGAGNWGEVMLNGWARHHDVNVVAICDLDKQKAVNLANKFSIQNVYDDAAAMLEAEQIEVVGVATPDFAHRDPVVLALEHNKKVLVQKPLATTVEDARAMLDAEQKSDGFLMVDFQHRWGVGMSEAARAIKNPDFGFPVHGRVRMSNARRVPLNNIAWAGKSNVLWFIGTHTLDLLRFVMESEPIQVFAAKSNRVLQDKGLDTEDFFQSMIQFENGAWIQMENSWVLPAGDIDTIELSLDIYGSNECVRVAQSPSHIITHGKADSFSIPAGSRGAILGRHGAFDHFLEVVRGNESQNISAFDGLMNTATLVAIERSAEEGRPVTLKEILEGSVVHA